MIVTLTSLKLSFYFPSVHLSILPVPLLDVAEREAGSQLDARNGPEIQLKVITRTVETRLCSREGRPAPILRLCFLLQGM